MAPRVTKRMIYPTLLEVGERDPALLARVVNNAIAGNLNAIGDVEVIAGTTETRIDDPRIGPQSFFIFMSLDETSRVMNWWLKERGTRYAIIGHDLLPAGPGSAWVEYVVIG